MRGNCVMGMTCVHAQSCLTLCDPTDYSPPGPLSTGFPRQEYWSGLPFPSAGDLPDPGMEPMSPALQADSLPLSHLGGALVIPKPGPCVLCYFIWYWRLGGRWDLWCSIMTLISGKPCRIICLLGPAFILECTKTQHLLQLHAPQLNSWITCL